MSTRRGKGQGLCRKCLPLLSSDHLCACIRRGVWGFWVKVTWHWSELQIVYQFNSKLSHFFAGCKETSRAAGLWLELHPHQNIRGRHIVPRNTSAWFILEEKKTRGDIRTNAGWWTPVRENKVEQKKNNPNLIHHTLQNKEFNCSRDTFNVSECRGFDSKWRSVGGQRIHA